MYAEQQGIGSRWCHGGNTELGGQVLASVMSPLYRLLEHGEWSLQAGTQQRSS